MKKIWLVLLILVLSLNVMACGDDKANETEIDKVDEAGDNEKVDEIQIKGVIAEEVEKYGNLNEFETMTFDDKIFDQDDFSDYDITMINIWGTFCGPCIKELPELAELAKEIPENVNLIGLCTDYSGNEEYAKKLLSDVDAEYTNIVLSPELQNSFAKNIQYVPTTVFVDSKGNIIGRIKVGAPAGDVKEAYMKLIEEALEAIK